MIEFNQVSLRVGTRVLIDNFTATISPKMHVGIVGKNGTGKTSLFNLILGHYETDKGSLYIQPHLRIAYVEQEIRDIHQTVLDYVLSGDDELIALRNAEEVALSNNDGMEISRIHGELERIDGYRANSRAATLLQGLGFKQEELSLPLTQFSGGWRMRLNIAKALMCRSDILLLDEPTNHLDFETVVWLEEWLNRYTGILLIISHDREFLEATCQSILHLENGTATLYSGTYSDFLRLRSEKLALQQAMYEKNEKTKAHLQDFIRRFGAKATKAKQAQSRVKALAKLADIAPVVATNTFQFSFLSPERTPEPLLVMNEVDIGYVPSQPILRSLSLTLTPDSRLGLLGKNGEGKSTLIKAIAGELSIENGTFTPSEYLKIGYFAQHQLEYLTLSESPLWHIQQLDKKASTQEIRNFLGQFDFHGDKALESIERFSGGEKARLALAMIVYQKPNLLLLDEPTNHLDLEMREAIALALQSFEGGVVIVSHDASLLEMCCDQFAVIHQGQLSYFEGDLNDYRKYVVENNQKEAHSTKNNPTESTAPENKIDYNERKNLNNELKRLMREKTEIEEKQIPKQQQKVDKIDAILNDTETYQTHSHDEIQNLNQEKMTIIKEIETLEERWLDADARIEEINTLLSH